MPDYTIGGFVLTLGDICAVGSRIKEIHLSATSIHENYFLHAYGVHLSTQAMINEDEIFALDEKDETAVIVIKGYLSTQFR